MTSQPKRIALLYLALVFLAGSVFGAAFHRFYAVEFATAKSEPKSASDYRQRLIARLTEDLDLTAEQLQQLDPILDEIGQRYHEFREAIEPGFEAIRTERARRIMGILEPEQQSTYQEILDERQRRREEKKRNKDGKGGCH